MNIEAMAESFLQSYIKQTKTEIVPVICMVDRNTSRAVSQADVYDYLKTLDQDEAIRFDVSDTEVSEEMIHSTPEEEKVDFDLDTEAVILAKQLNSRKIYFAGVNTRTKRLVFTHDPRLARVFTSEFEIVTEAFQFNDEEAISILKESFTNLKLELVPAPPAPNF